MSDEKPSNSRLPAETPGDRTRFDRGRSRRTFLAMAASGAIGSFAGCLGSGRDDDPADDAGPNGSDAGARPPRTGTGHRASQNDGIEPPELPEQPLGAADVIELETGPRTLALPRLQYDRDCGVRVLVRAESTATSDSPAVFRAGLFNQRSEERTVRLQGLFPFVSTPLAIRDGDPDHYRYLVPTEETTLATTEPSYERDPEGYWRIDGSVRDWLPETIDLGPKESVGALFYLLGEPREGGFPTGQYRFGATGDPDRSFTVWHDDEPGPSPDSRFERGQFPGLTYRLADETVWYHDAAPETPRYVEPSAEREVLPAGVTFELVNNSAEGLSGGGGTWDLHKYVDGEWFPLASRFRTLEARILPPGGRYEWTFLAFNGPIPDGIDEPAHGHLGGGIYGFRPTYTLGSEETYGAAFELVGDPIEVVPTDGLETERDGDVVEVTDTSVPESPRDLLIVERIGAADESATDRVISEQLMSGREPGLRNALPFFEPGVETVELRTTGVALGQNISETDPRRFEYDGRAYEATLEELE